MGCFRRERQSDRVASLKQFLSLGMGDTRFDSSSQRGNLVFDRSALIRGGDDFAGDAIARSCFNIPRHQLDRLWP